MCPERVPGSGKLVLGEPGVRAEPNRWGAARPHPARPGVSLGPRRHPIPGLWGNGTLEHAKGVRLRSSGVS